MKIGKVAESVLVRSVLKQMKLNQGMKMIDGASVGADCAIFEPFMGGQMCSNMQEGAVRDATDLHRIFHRVANNLACAGGIKDLGAMVSLLVPETMEEQDLQIFTKEIGKVCKSLNMNVMGGQTNVSFDVDRLHVAVTGIAPVQPNHMTPGGRVLPGQDIVVSKWVGLEGTAMVAKALRDKLKERYPLYLIDEGEAFSQLMSIVPEAAVAMNTGAAAMHDVSEGGIFAALWELAESAGVGLEIDIKKIPIKQETVEICEFFDINPYKIVSGGCLLIATEDGNQMVRELEKAGIHAVVIGKATDSNDRVLLNEEERRFLETVQVDELYSVINK